MKKKILTMTIAGFLIAAMMVPAAVSARQGGSMKGQTQQIGTQANLQIRDQQRLKDGSCIDAAQKGTGDAQKKGNTYGPGDGTGNQNLGPKDGTGYGAPANR